MQQMCVTSSLISVSAVTRIQCVVSVHWCTVLQIILYSQMAALVAGCGRADDCWEEAEEPQSSTLPHPTFCLPTHGKRNVMRCVYVASKVPTGRSIPGVERVPEVTLRLVGTLLATYTHLMPYAARLSRD